MKIAILTLPLHTNYGGILQAYALQTVLQQMGHEVEVLQNTSSYSHNSLLMPLVYAKRIATRVLGKNNNPIFLERTKTKEKPIVEQHTQKFISDNINLRKIQSLSGLSPSDYEAIVVGSDQIWRKPYFCGMWYAPMKDAFLDFTKDWNIKRVSYSASFGLDNIDEYDENEIRQCKETIKQFDAVSVREDSGVKICKEKFDVNALHVLDPTMLLSKEYYLSLIEKSNVPESPGDLLCYVLDPTPFKNEVINIVSSENKLTPFKTNVIDYDYSIPTEQRIQPPVESWLRGFMDAKFVVTDSFHACVFSIIFGKPFLAIGNAGRGMSRFTSLLSSFGLRDRLIIDTLPDKNIADRIMDISDILDEKRGESFGFLKSALS